MSARRLTPFVVDDGGIHRTDGVNRLGDAGV
jgi:hypothetical protein